MDDNFVSALANQWIRSASSSTIRSSSDSTIGLTGSSTSNCSLDSFKIKNNLKTQVDSIIFQDKWNLDLTKQMLYNKIDQLNDKDIDRFCIDLKHPNRDQFMKLYDVQFFDVNGIKVINNSSEQTLNLFNETLPAGNSFPISSSCPINNSLPDNLLLDNRLPDNLLLDNRLSDNRLPDNRLPDNLLLDNRLPDNFLLDNRQPDNRLPDNRLPDNLLSDNRSSTNSNADQSIGNLFTFNSSYNNAVNNLTAAYLSNNPLNNLFNDPFNFSNALNLLNGSTTSNNTFDADLLNSQLMTGNAQPFFINTNPHVYQPVSIFTANDQPESTSENSVIDIKPNSNINNSTGQTNIHINTKKRKRRSKFKDNIFNYIDQNSIDDNGYLVYDKMVVKKEPLILYSKNKLHQSFLCPNCPTISSSSAILTNHLDCHKLTYDDIKEDRCTHCNWTLKKGKMCRQQLFKHLTKHFIGTFIIKYNIDVEQLNESIRSKQWFSQFYLQFQAGVRPAILDANEPVDNQDVTLSQNVSTIV